MGSATRARPRLLVHWGPGERLGPGETNGRWSKGQEDTQAESREQPSGPAGISQQLPVPSRPQVSFFLFVIFTVYAMLPLGMRDAAAAGLASSLSHLLVLGLYLGPQPDSRPALLPQVSTPWVPLSIHQPLAEL